MAVGALGMYLGRRRTGHGGRSVRDEREEGELSEVDSRVPDGPVPDEEGAVLHERGDCGEGGRETSVLSHPPETFRTDL